MHCCIDKGGFYDGCNFPSWCLCKCSGCVTAKENRMTKPKSPKSTEKKPSKSAKESKPVKEAKSAKKEVATDEPRPAQREG